MSQSVYRKKLISLETQTIKGLIMLHVVPNYPSKSRDQLSRKVSRKRKWETGKGGRKREGGGSKLQWRWFEMWKTCERENLAFFAGELAESGVIIKRPETKKVQKDHQLRSWIIMQSDDRKKKKKYEKIN